MYVRLVAYIPDQYIVRRIVHIVKGKGKFCNSKAGFDMPGLGLGGMQHKITQLSGQLCELYYREFSEISRSADRVQ